MASYLRYGRQPRENFDRPSTAFNFVIETDDGSGWSAVTDSRFLVPLSD